MYGMIHKVARELGLAALGEASWRDLKAACGLGSEHFISGQYYSDEVTAALLGALAAKMNLSTDALLTRLGRRWIVFAGQSSYGAVMDLAGDDLGAFIRNLDRMHASIKAIMPEAVLPSFEVTKETAAGLTVVYRSERQGLEPFVVGLFEGLLERFGETGSVAFAGGNGHAVFEISRGAAARVA